MDLKKVSDMQRKLDSKVFARAGVDATDTVDQRLLALAVELSELANELSCFKYWKQSHVMKLNETKEEWADVLHFAASVGNTYGHKLQYKHLNSLKPQSKEEVTRLLLYMMGLVPKIHSRIHYVSFMECLFDIARYIGMDENEMMHQYILKNDKNYQRIVSNY